MTAIKEFHEKVRKTNGKLVNGKVKEKQPKPIALLIGLISYVVVAICTATMNAVLAILTACTKRYDRLSDKQKRRLKYIVGMIVILTAISILWAVSYHTDYQALISR